MPDDEEREDFGFDALTKRLEGSLGSEESMANGTMNELQDASFMDTVRKAKTAIVMFYRPTCPFCKQLTPLLKDLAEEYESKVYFAMVNVDEIKGVREEYKILGVPVTVAFKKGTPVARVDGLRGVDDYDSWIEQVHQGIRPMGLESGQTSDL